MKTPNATRLVAKAPAPLLSFLQASFPHKTKDQLLSLVLCGCVCVNDATVKRHTQGIKQGDVVLVHTDARHYASRGAHKIAPVLDAWNAPIAGKVWLDVGSSTGGFTDCLLERGAHVVHAVDVGYNLLSYRIRNNPRVRVHERTNITQLHTLEPQPHRAVVDVSFRSLAKILAHTLKLCQDKYLIALCKPQFEFAHYKKSALQTQQNKAFCGVVYNNELRKNIVKHTIETLEKEGVFTHRICAAGLAGRKGNQEFFLEITDTVPRAKPNLEAALA